MGTMKNRVARRLAILPVVAGLAVGATIAAPSAAAMGSGWLSCEPPTRVTANSTLAVNTTGTLWVNNFGQSFWNHTQELMRVNVRGHVSAGSWSAQGMSPFGSCT